MDANALSINNSISILVANAINSADPAAGLRVFARSDVHDRKNYLQPFLQAAAEAGCNAADEKSAFLALQARNCLQGMLVDQLVNEYARIVADSVLKHYGD